MISVVVLLGLLFLVSLEIEKSQVSSVFTSIKLSKQSGYYFFAVWSRLIVLSKLRFEAEEIEKAWDEVNIIKTKAEKLYQKFESLNSVYHQNDQDVMYHISHLSDNNTR